MENIKEIRLKVLKRNFREKPYVGEGYRKLSNLIKKEYKNLGWLLRNHFEDPIETTEEVVFRDQVDYLLSYYSLLIVGVISDYVPADLDAAITSEAKLILNNDKTERYFKKYYKLYLPQLLKKYFDNKNILPTELYEHGLSSKFDKFLILYRNRIEDEDIGNFLWLLDDGSFYEKDTQKWLWLGNLWHILKERDLLSESLNRGDSSILTSVVWGFAKYINFINVYSDFHRSCADTGLFASAIWHMDSYWLNHLEKKIGKEVKKGIVNISSLLQQNGSVRVDVEELDPEIFEQWKKDSEKEIDRALKNIDYMFDPSKGELIKNLVKNVN